MPGTFIRHANFASRFVAPRHIDIWLPPGYEENNRRCPVLYMHDGQNLFNPAESYTGVPWGVDEAIVQLSETGKITAPIVVGIWNTALRRQEYLPAKPFTLPAGQEMRQTLDDVYQGEPLSDEYLCFITEEVKAFVDATYRTQPEREATFIMGSSMGGLISLYALCEYPQVFAGAGCLSTHWPAGRELWVAYLRQGLPPPGRHTFYFDYGTEGLDAAYEQYQLQVDSVMRQAGYTEGSNWVTRKFPGDDHSESFWRKRVHIPLALFFSPPE
jgi:predicted alpha/beta superfamily hydrolase